MSYKVDFKSIYSAHSNAWYALFGGEYSGFDCDETIKQYHEKYHAKLIDDVRVRRYTDIEFDSESDYVMFMLEWS
jgi:hypothetical protein